MRSFSVFPDLASKLSFEDIEVYFRTAAAKLDIGGENAALVTQFYHWSSEPVLKPDNDGYLYASDETVSWISLGAPNFYLHEITVKIINPMILLNQVVCPEQVDHHIGLNRKALVGMGLNIDCLITSMNPVLAKCNTELLGIRQICFLQPKNSVINSTCLGRLSHPLAKIMESNIVSESMKGM